jgi:SAM-dependent methyltransferase
MNAKDWERLADKYAEEVCDIFLRDRRGVIAAWLHAQGLLDGRRSALDLGCGIGSFFRKYGRHFAAKTGADHSARMVRLAAQRCRTQPDIHWRVADVFALPAEWRASADLVVCANVISFVQLGTCRRALRQVVRTVKPGGCALLIIPALESHDAVVALERGRAAVHRRGITAVVQRDDRRQRFFTRDGVRQLARCAGLSRVEVRKVWYPWIDEGFATAPRGCEPPWDWLVTGRRPRSNETPRSACRVIAPAR